MSMFDKPILVFQTDFTYAEGAVSSMYGVVKTVDRELEIFDGTHQIPQYDTWSASYRLYQSLQFWPEGTIYVSVVDPGVGTKRRACVAKVKGGYYVVTPDNGSLTHLKKFVGIEAVREIDETINRLPRSGESYTFHGRDVYAYTGARLASGIIDFEGVGPALDPESLTSLPIVEPYIDGKAACGTIDVLDVRFGSLWTNIPRTMFLETGIRYGDRFSITIENDTRCVYRNIILFAKSFADVYVGEALAYVNSLDCVAVAINQGSFARAYNIGTGNSWRIRIAPFKGF